MRILTETVIRGELMEMELTEQDFCPECCGTLEAGGSGQRVYLKCLSCYVVFRPKRAEPGKGE
jgi:tRNA(Ile2) C34 agmatinyltransferase TiaS